MRKPMLWTLAIAACCSAAAGYAQQTASAQPVPIELKPSSQAASKQQTASLTEQLSKRDEYEAFRRKELADQVVKTYYLAHLKAPSEMQEVQNTLRTILEFNRITPIASPPAIVVRAYPDQIAQADKLVAELDRAKAATPPPPPPPPPAQATAAPASTNPSYRLEFTLTEYEDGKKVNARTYSMIVQRAASRAEGAGTQIRVGSRVPVATGSFSSGNPNALVNTQFQYMDVGVNIDCKLWGTDDDLTLGGTVEVSGMSEPRNIGGISQPVVRQTKAGLTGGITAGKSTTIAAMDAADSPRRMEISVTPTKLK